MSTIIDYNRLVAEEIRQLQAEVRQLRNELGVMAAAQRASPAQLRTGVDLIEIDRIRTAIARHGAHFLNRIFTVDEMAHCAGRVESLAARFAGKEAVAKALGTGIWRHGINWTDIEITRDTASGAPLLRLQRAAAARAETLNLHEWSLSLSHDRQRAVALVVGWRT